MTYQPDPGTTLAAADAIADGQELFTREQVAYLVHLAYLSGANARTRLDAAEMEGMREEHPLPRYTRQQRIAARLAEMERRSGPPTYFGGPVDWETGIAVRTLRAAA